MNKSLLNPLFIFLVLISLNLGANKPPVKYFIQFKDKAGSPYSLSKPHEFLSMKAVERRLSYNITLDNSDLPVISSYVQQVAAVPNVTIKHHIKWLNGVVISLDSIDLAPAALQQINGFAFVVSSKQVKKYKVTQDAPESDQSPLIKSRGTEVSSSAALSTYALGGSYQQNHMMKLDCLHERGYRGQGMTIAVLDNGFGYVDSNPVFDSLRARKGILGGRDFVSGGTNPYQGGTHGSMVFSCMAALVPGLIMGSAPMAEYWLLRTEEPSENVGEEFNWIRGAEFADSAGADILTTSLGYTEFDDPALDHSYTTLNGRTAPMSIAATMAARKGLFVLNAAGNERANSWHFISVPADADSICTVGAVDSLGIGAAFSSMGPTADGRIKPDLVARGAGTWVSQTNLTCFPGNGTSFATPVMAGAVACYWQAHRKNNNIEILRSLKKFASNASNPNNDIGWGLPNLCHPEDFDFEVNNDRINSRLGLRLIDDYSEEVHVIVSDLSGKKVFDGVIHANHRDYIIQTSGLSDGIYAVTIETSNGRKGRKFIR